MFSLLLSQWRLCAWAGLAVAIAMLAGLWRLEAGRTAHLQSTLRAAQAAQANAQADAAAATAAGALAAAGAARDAGARQTHTENAYAIQSAPGSGQGLDPALNDAGRRGLCGYRAYQSDPACIQLRGPDSSQRPDAGSAHPSAPH